MNWWIDIENAGSHFIRFHFAEIRDSGPGDYEIAVLNGSLTRVVTYTPAEFRTRHSFWSPFVEGSFLRVLVISKTARLPTGLEFRIGEYVYEAPGAVLESIKDQNDPKLRPISAYASDKSLLAEARSVAKLRAVGEDAVGTCTGFMVGSDLLLTNEHCVPTPSICESMQAHFDWDPRTAEPADKRFECVKLERVDHNLDYALVRLKGNPGRQDRWGQLSLLARSPMQGERLYVIQYPGTREEKQVAREGCALVTPAAPGRIPSSQTDFGHSCDTKTGSSGSPVLDLSHRVVGLHHWGFDLLDMRWNDENRAVRMERVLDAVRPFLK